MKYTHKRNRRRIVRGGQNSPKVEKLGCCGEAVFRVMDKIFPHEPSRPRSATSRSRRPVNTPYGRPTVTARQSRKIKASGTKRRGKKRKT